MKALLKNKKVLTFLAIVIVGALTTFLGVDKEAAGKLVSGCQKSIEEANP